MTIQSERIILGIDPGTNIMGYGLIFQRKDKGELIDMGVFNLSKIKSPELKIKSIFDSMISLLDTYHPDFMAIEAPFYGKNVQSMLKLGRAQGVAIAAALSREIPYCEYSPRRIKQSVTGNGAASKEQVACMLQRILNISDMPKYLDATDALAIAYCHLLQREVKTDKTSTSGSWANFLANHKDRILG